MLAGSVAFEYRSRPGTVHESNPILKGYPPLSINAKNSFRCSVLSVMIYSLVPSPTGLCPRVQHIMDIRPDTGLKQDVYRPVCITAPIPAYRNCPTIFAAQLCYTGRHSQSRSRKIRHNPMAAAIRQHFREIRMLVGVSSAAQSKLVCPPPAFLQSV